MEEPLATQGDLDGERAAHSPTLPHSGAWAPRLCFCPTHLDPLVQQLQGQVLQGDSGSGVEARLAEQARDACGVTGLAPGVDILEGLEVIVQCMAHHNLALQKLKDL